MNYPNFLPSLPATRWLAACAAGAVLAAASASAQNIISFSFTDNGDNSSNPQSGYLETSDLAGAPGIRVGNWNNLLGKADDQHPSATVYDGVYGDTETVFYNDGSVVGGGFTFSSQSGFSDRDSGSFINDQEMYNGVKDSYGGNFTIALANIPFAQYDIYCYMRDDGTGRIGTYTIDSLTYYARGGLGDPDNTGAGYIRSTDSNGGDGVTLTDYDQGNYVEFTGLTGSSLTLATDAIGIGTVPRNKVAGIQIVGVPEPGVLALAGLGIGGLLALRRRRA